MPGLSAALVGIDQAGAGECSHQPIPECSGLRADLVRLQSGTVRDIPQVFSASRRWWRTGLAVGLPFIAMLLLWVGSKVQLNHLLPQKAWSPSCRLNRLAKGRRIAHCRAD